MLPGMELMGCADLAVPPDVMHHVVHVESAFNPYAIGVVGGRLARQPRTLAEAIATARMLEGRGFNFSLGLAQVNRYNLGRYGLPSYEAAFSACPNLKAGSRILAECRGRSGGDWGKAFSCYYSGNFETGFRHGYVRKIFASMQAASAPLPPGAVPAIRATPGAAPRGMTRRSRSVSTGSTLSRRIWSADPVTKPVGHAAPVAASALMADKPSADRGDGVAVIDPAGGPPRIVSPGLTVPSAPPATSQVIPASPSDTAFVF